MLLVDNDPETREQMASMLLADGGITVDAVSSGQAAMERLSGTRYDAVISDYQMPEMDGIDLLRTARAEGFLNTFLLFSEHADEEAALDAILNGADHYLPLTGRLSQDVALVRIILHKHQKQQESEKERRTAEIYHSLLMRMNEGFAYHRIIFDDGGNPVSSMIIDANTAFERFVDMTGETVLGRDVRSLLTSDDSFERMLLTSCDAIIRSGAEIRFDGYSHRRRKWFSVLLFPSEAGSFVTTLTDITAQKTIESPTHSPGPEDAVSGLSPQLVEQELEMTRKKLRLLGSVTRHDILNKLAALHGYLALTQYKTDPTEIKGIVTKADNAADQIRKILEFSRAYEKLGSQRPEWILAKEAVSIGMTESYPPETRVTVSLEGLEIYADRMIEKVFYNLADNAVRHGKASQIDIFYERDGEELRIVFQDDGLGVSVAAKPAMFDDRFGHGLYLVKEILKLTGMSIKEASQGGGARFEITVPSGSYRLS